MTKGKGTPRYSTSRRPESTATAGSAVLTYTDQQSNASAQAYQSTSSANLYGPDGTFGGQFTTGTVSGGYSLALAHTNGSTYSTTMPDPSTVPNGQSTYNGVTFTIDQNAGTASAVYQNTTVTASYDASNDSITINLPDGSVGLYPNVSHSAPAQTASGSRRAPQQAAAAIGICILRILVAVIVTVITVIVIAIAVGVCVSLGWNLIGLVGCIFVALVALVFVIITIFVWIIAWVWCFAPPPPLPPGPVPMKPVAQQQVATRGWIPRAVPA